jgi:Tfp pilus assembly protein PilO
MASLKSTPFYLMLFAFLGYLGFEYYTFSYSPEGEVELHRSALASANSELEGLRKKLADGNKFMKSLDQKREEIRAQIVKLGEYQGALSEAPDVPVLLRLLDTEAKRAELKVDRIEPGKKDQREYYLEQEFKLDVRGTFQNLLLFIHRVSQLQRILRIEGVTLRIAASSVSAKAITLSANLSVRAYQYTLSKEDKLQIAEIPKDMIGSEGSPKKESDKPKMDDKLKVEDKAGQKAAPAASERPKGGGP